MSTITITLKLFAAYQEVCGIEQLTWELPVNTTVATVAEQLYHTHPQLAQWRTLTRYGVNLEFVDPQTLLQDGDEVVFIPPVSGG